MTTTSSALRAAYELQVPIVYFIGTRPGCYKPVFPCFVRTDDPEQRIVLVSPGALVGPVDEPEPARLDDPIERRYTVRQTRVKPKGRSALTRSVSKSDSSSSSRE